MAEPWNPPPTPTVTSTRLTIWPNHTDTQCDDRPDTNGAAVEPEFISIPEWARRIGISNESAYKAARLGQIPGCFNIGRLYRVNWPVFVEATSSMRSGNGIA
jgi:predicted DNA-binding transcriptional regulator AlpA